MHIYNIYIYICIHMYTYISTNLSFFFISGAGRIWRLPPVVQGCQHPVLGRDPRTQGRPRPRHHAHAPDDPTHICYAWQRVGAVGAVFSAWFFARELWHASVAAPCFTCVIAPVFVSTGYVQDFSLSVSLSLRCNLSLRYTNGYTY